MNEEEAIGFTKGALEQAIKWDGSSGGVIRMVVLTKVSYLPPPAAPHSSALDLLYMHQSC